MTIWRAPSPRRPLLPAEPLRALAIATATLLFSLTAVRLPAATPKHPLRVCADPNNLPFSNRAGRGFENEIARLLAKDLGTTLEYTWWAQRRGFFRNTLKAGLCDVVMGAPVGFDPVDTTRAYYRSSYVFVSRADRGPRIDSFDDPRLRTLKVGVQVVGDDYANTPPVHALSERGIVENVVGYSLFGDYSVDNPPAAVVKAVDSGEVDVAAVWGPLAGYFARQAHHRLELTPIARAATDERIPLEFEIGIAVRKHDDARREQLDAFLVHRKGEIADILDRFGVPRR